MRNLDYDIQILNSEGNIFDCITMLDEMVAIFHIVWFISRRENEVNLKISLN